MNRFRFLLIGIVIFVVSFGGYSTWLYRHSRSFHNTLSLHFFTLLGRSNEHRLLLIGDSNIVSLDCPTAFSRWKVLNLGFPGIRSQQLRSYLQAHLGDFSGIDASLLWVGLNDARSEVPAVDKASEMENRIIDDLSKISRFIGVLAQPLLPNQGHDPGIKNVNRYIIDLNSMVVDRAGQRLSIISPLALTGDEAGKSFSADGLHLNDQGYQQVCSAVGRWLDRIY